VKAFAAFLFAGLTLVFTLLPIAQNLPDPLTVWAYPWAYPTSEGESDSATDPDKSIHVPESTVMYSYKDTRDIFHAPDWHPDDHPSIPAVVEYGRKPAVFACGYCHRADGSGGPENASLAGLPHEYIVQQVAAFKNGTRKATISPDNGPFHYMHAVATAVTESETNIAATYFSAIKPKRNIAVVETDTIPTTRMVGHFFAYVKNGSKEPIGNRIVEVPNDEEQFENRDPRTQFTAYVPVGSLKRGELLATGKDPQKAVRCETCHGPGLRGSGLIPRIAGRSPSFIARQLYDFKHGGRTGSASAPMLAVVANLSSDDMQSLAAYVSSLSP